MKEITVQQLKQKMDQRQDFQLIDVREEFEYSLSNIGGEHIPLGSILLESYKISRDKPVIVQCRSGARSAAAIAQLEQTQQFANLYNLVGGIYAWKKEINPLMKIY